MLRWQKCLINFGVIAIATTTTVARAEDFNLLLDAEKVKYRRAEEPKYYPALIGETYRGTDYLRVSTNGKALVICRNGSKWQVPADNQSHQIKQNCPSSPDSRGVEERNFWQLLRDAFLAKALPEYLGSLRGDSDANIPYIITPRNTTILSDRPPYAGIELLMPTGMKCNY